MIRIIGCRRQGMTLTDDDQVSWRVYALLGHNEYDIDRKMYLILPCIESHFMTSS